METVFSLLACALFFYIYIKDLKKLRVSRRLWLKSALVKFTIYSFIIVVISILTVNIFLIEPLPGSHMYILAMSLFLSAIIARVWLTYLKWIDVFEPERNIYLAITFIMSCATLLLVFPITDMIQSFGFTINGNPLNDFLYSTIAIGSVEEVAKLIPLLIMLVASKQLNEPIDYIVYASVSALGFAFIENILYIEKTGLSALSARLLYSSVAHMFFSSIIGYTLAINVIKKRRRFFLHLFLGLVLASLAHGFYDFWLINKEFYLPIVTTIFYVGSLHIWVTLKNNLINNTNFYRPDIKLDRENIKYKLITSIVFTIYAGYILFAILNGAKAANAFLAYSAISFLFLVVYISLSFSSFNIIRGFIAPIRFPVKFFLPKVDAYPNYSGIEISLTLLRGGRPRLEYKGHLIKRMVINKDYNWYLFEETDTNSQLLLKPLEYSTDFNKEAYKKMKVCFYKESIPHSFLHLENEKVSRPQKGVAYLK
jgi:RsiW-degrading membrane proteinase PrsW (M82 family)